MLDALGLKAHGQYKQDEYMRQTAHTRPLIDVDGLSPVRLLRPACPPFALRRLHVATQEAIQLVDITDDVAAHVRDVGQLDGIVTIFSQHTTAAIRIQEDEPLLRQDICDFLARCAPPDGELQLGTWQRLFLVELDGPRPHREVLLQLLSVGQ
jgi:thiamine phosphate synthase YjbQ (UPF0047 family)